MPDLPGHSPLKAARILSAAGELLLARGSKGVTIAEVARRAHIGTGTVYLYWKNKEDLLLELVCRDFLAVADEITALATADPGFARPSRMVPNMLRVAADHPYVSALQRGDRELLGVLTADPRAAGLLALLGPVAVMRRVLPIWRDHGLARTDWDLDDQAYALNALVTGFITAAQDASSGTDGARVLAAAATALLGPETATADQVQAAADEGIRVLAVERQAALDLTAGPVAAVR